MDGNGLGEERMVANAGAVVEDVARETALSASVERNVGFFPSSGFS